MKIIMKNSYNKRWFIYLFIIGIQALTTHSYGNIESLTDDNDANESKKVDFESLIKTMNGRHRVRRSAYNPATVTNIAEIFYQTSTAADNSGTYIVTSYSFSSPTTETTTVIAQTDQSITPNPAGNGTYIITAYYSNSPVGSTQSTTSTTTSQLISTTPTTSSTCNSGTYVTLTNGTCVSRESLIAAAINTLNSNSSNDTDKANAISTYITGVTNSNISLNSSNTLPIDRIDGILGNLTVANYTVSTNDSIIVITQPKACANVPTVIGASFELIYGPTVINTVNRNNITNSLLSAAGVVNLTGQCNITQFNMLIINNPTLYQSIDNSTNSTLISSIVMATVQTDSDDPLDININLYFQTLTQSNPTENGAYLCAFYDAKTSQWNQSGCLRPQFNAQFDRYECSCNHLTSFALIWLPQPPYSLNGTPPELDAQDKASIAFQLLSIICFLGIIIHGITVRIMHSQKYTQSRHLLPLISCGITMILFIFYIALGLTVYNRYKQSNPNIETTTPQGRNLPIGLNSRADSSSTNSSSITNACLSNEHALMFIVYFLIIFMFCSKTSIGFYNYRHYVKLFPPPSPLLLAITIGISFLISIIWLSIAAGLNSNSSNDISEVYLGKICWFTRSVIHYFLTIPICLFLAINLAMFIPVVKHNITHAKIKENERSSYIRRKECIYILLSSAITQGFGWLFGPLMLIASPNAADVLGWLFIIFNGLEGVWAILLYIVIEKEGIENTQRYTDDKDRDLRHDDHDVSQFELDVANIDRRPDQLAIMRSESPRNSFANFPASDAHHRRYQVNDTDQLT